VNPATVEGAGVAVLIGIGGFAGFQAGLWAAQDNGPNHPTPPIDLKGGIQPSYPLPGTTTVNINTNILSGSESSTTATLPQPSAAIAADNVVAHPAASGDIIVRAKGEYYPQGLSREDRNAFREAIHTLKQRVWRVPPDYNVPKEVLDAVADIIKNGGSAQDAVNDAPDLPEGDVSSGNAP
jgi:hypothetical protein